MKSRIICATFLLTIILSCSKRADDEAIIAKVDITSPVSVSLFDYVDRVELIQLENTQEAMLSGGDYAISDDAFYILGQKNQNIYSFSTNGILRSRVNRAGRGNGEYTMSDDIVFCQQDSSVLILNPMGLIYKYSIPEGYRFLSMTEINGNLRSVHNIWPLDRGNYLLFSMSEDNRVYFLGKDSDPKVLNSSHPRWIEFSPFCSSRYPFYEYGNAVRYFSGFDGTIYTYNSNQCTLVPYLIWDFGKNQISVQDVPEKDMTSNNREVIMSTYKEINKSKAAPVFNVCETSRYILTDAYFRGEDYTVIYDKKKQSTQCFSKTIEGVLFCPSKSYKGDCFRYVSPDKLGLFVNESVLSDEYSKHIFEGIKDDSNMIIIKYYMKD